MDESMKIVLENSAFIIATILASAIMIWIAFVEAAQMFESKCGPGFPGTWWEYPFVPVFGYFVTTIITALAMVLITRHCVENILEALRNAGMINF